MIFLKRKRLIFWLFKAYLKKWGKTIALSFILCPLIFFIIYLNRNFIISKIPITGHENIGLVGIYSVADFPNNMPDSILTQLSRGLTKVSSEGKVTGDIATRWDIKDDGKTFIFYLKSNILFSDGKMVNSGSIRYNFEDVIVEKPTRDIIVFKLKNKYSPFPVTLSNYKVFKNKNIGVSDYKINKVKSNSGYIDFIELYSKKDKKIIKYDFYETQEALKNAYVLGEVSKIVDVSDIKYKKNISFSDFKNTNIIRKINEDKIVTVFFNNQDSSLSDKKIRKALAYSLPDNFSDGRRTYSSYKSDFWVSDSANNYQYDLEYSKLLLEQTEATKGASFKIELKTLPQYRSLAEEISGYWKKIGIGTEIQETVGVPRTYQAFLGELPVFKDPDQYTLWHSSQSSNITHFRNLRIDKLLEDGRRTYSSADRREIYLDFQKYLIDDMPAAFLFFPYTYTISRK